MPLEIELNRPVSLSLARTERDGNISDSFQFREHILSFGTHKPVSDYMELQPHNRFTVNSQGSFLEWQYASEGSFPVRLYVPPDFPLKEFEGFDGLDESLNRLANVLNGYSVPAGDLYKTKRDRNVDELVVDVQGKEIVPLMLVLRTPFGAFFNPGYLDGPAGLQFLMGRWYPSDFSRDQYNGEESTVLIPRSQIRNCSIALGEVPPKVALAEQYPF